LRLAAETGGAHRIFPEAGHYLQIEQADAVADTILSMITSQAD